MIPFEFSYGTKQQEGTPRYRGDFDLPYAYQALGVERRRGERSIWRTRLWVNFFVGAVASVIGYGLWLAPRYDLFADHVPLLGKLAIGFFLLILCAAFVIMALFSLMRGTLVLDRRTRELTFFRFWFSFRPHRRLSLDRVRALSRREVMSPGTDQDPGHTYDILVAELHDDRLASIAIDSPLSVEIEIQKAAGLEESAACRRRRQQEERIEHRIREKRRHNSRSRKRGTAW